MKPLQKRDLAWVSLLLLSGIITYISIQVGTDRASSGQPALIWLHVLLFLSAIALVLVAIYLKAKQ